MIIKLDGISLEQFSSLCAFFANDQNKPPEHMCFLVGIKPRPLFCTLKAVQQGHGWETMDNVTLEVAESMTTEQGMAPHEQLPISYMVRLFAALDMYPPDSAEEDGG